MLMVEDETMTKRNFIAIKCWNKIGKPTQCGRILTTTRRRVDSECYEEKKRRGQVSQNLDLLYTVEQGQDTVDQERGCKIIPLTIF
jgi:hypothetical protein